MSGVSQRGSRRTRSRSHSSGSRVSSCLTSPSPSCAHLDVSIFIFFESLSPGVRPRPRALPLGRRGDVPRPRLQQDRRLRVPRRPWDWSCAMGDPGPARGRRCDSSLTDAASPGRRKWSSLPASPPGLPASQGHDACHVLEMREGRPVLPEHFSPPPALGGARGSPSEQPTPAAGRGLIFFTSYLGHFEPLRKSRNGTVSFVLLASLVRSVPLPALCLLCDLEANPRHCSISSVNVSVRVCEKRGQIHF